MYDFRNFKTIRTFGEDIYEGEITSEDADKDQLDLSNKIKNFYDKARPKNKKKKKKKRKKEITLHTLYEFYNALKWLLMVLKVKYF